MEKLRKIESENFRNYESSAADYEKLAEKCQVAAEFT
jgi:hypothetical protein